jgi:hypothetical protein
MANIKMLNKITQSTTQKFWLSNTNTKNTVVNLQNVCLLEGSTMLAPLVAPVTLFSLEILW